MPATTAATGADPTGAPHWERIGFHRPLGQFFWNYILLLFMAVIALLFFSVVIPNFLLPFPEVFGFYGIVTAMFNLLFVVLNAGTSDVVTRYVSEHSVSNPRMCLEYIRFFVWFQMISGLCQVTGIAIFSLYFMPLNLEYMKWMFIIYATIQYPGMLGVYSGCLNGFQRFDKTNLLSILSQAIIQPGVLVFFVLLCREIGAATPAYGEMMGALIGYVIGNYLDDFITFSVSARMFRPVLEKIGFRLRDTLVPRVSREVARNSIVFGTKIMASGMLYEAVHFMANLMIIAWLPHYGTIIGIYGIAKGVCDIALIQLPMTPVLSEAYNHQKHAMFAYGVSFQLKYIGLIVGFLSIEIGMILPVVLYNIIGGNYTIAAYIIPVLLPIRTTAIWCRFIDQVQIGASKPNYFVATRVVEQVTRLLAHLLLLHPRLIPSIVPSAVELSFLGGRAMAIPVFFILYSFCDLPGIIAKITFGFWITRRKILQPVGKELRFPWWQMFGAMALVFVIMIAVNGGLVSGFLAIKEFGNIAMYAVAVLYLFIMLFGSPFLIFLLYSLFGGWDDYGLSIVKDAIALSGPSRRYITLLYRVSAWGHARSPWKNRFPIPHADAAREIAELDDIKRRAWEAVQAAGHA